MMDRLFHRGPRGLQDTAENGTQAAPASKFKPEPRAAIDDTASSSLVVPCPKCKEPLYVKELEDNLHVCPKCGAHLSLNARQRIAYTVDAQSFVEWDRDVQSADPLGFAVGNEAYAAKLAAARAKTNEVDAMVTGAGTIAGVPVALAVANFAFIGATMGSVYGEKLARAAERARAARMPLITFNASGGARMQEGLFSLMQMAKTTAAVARLGEAGLPHISVLTDPCYGGVTASYATVADIILAEPGARIGFAGKTMIAQIMKKKLPEDAQTAEFQLEHGMIDDVVHRRDLRKTLGSLLALYRTPRQTRSPLPAPERETEAPTAFAHIPVDDAALVHSHA